MRQRIFWDQVPKFGKRLKFIWKAATVASVFHSFNRIKCTKFKCGFNLIGLEYNIRTVFKFNGPSNADLQTVALIKSTVPLPTFAKKKNIFFFSFYRLSTFQTHCSSCIRAADLCVSRYSGGRGNWRGQCKRN